MPQINLNECASVALFVVTALLLTYASSRTPNTIRRYAALTSLATVSGALYFMAASYSGDDSWWTFERPGPFVRKQIKDRGHFEFVDEEGDNSGEKNAKSNASAAAGSASDDKNNSQNGGLVGAAANKIASLLPVRASSAVGGDLISDCQDCPDLIVVEPGFFRMGAVPGDELALETERPRQTVMVRKRFAIGRTEVTVGQYAFFVRDSGHPQPACGFADPVRDTHMPINCVSWRDAVAYTQWLTTKTARAFRLPSEAEWQYAARGGASTRFATGNDIPEGNANFASRRPRRVPVGSYPANGFGLSDVHGNVAEMVADCWSPTLNRAPGDAREWNRRGDCTFRVLKDAHAGEPEALSRLSARRPIPLADQRLGVGFRVVRDL